MARASSATARPLVARSRSPSLGGLSRRPGERLRPARPRAGVGELVIVRGRGIGQREERMALRRLVAIVGSLAGPVTAGCKDGASPSAAITVTAVSPAAGPIVGGTSITITGVNFINVTSVTIGVTELAGRTVMGTTQITGTTPAGVAFGLANVVVTSSSQRVATCSGCFTYEPLGIVGQPLAAGTNHTCALRINGAAYCWGGDGNLGDGSTTASSTPVAVSGGLSFSVLVAYAVQTCGL